MVVTEKINKHFPNFVKYYTANIMLRSDIKISIVKWPAHTKAAEFWTVLRIYFHVPSWANQILQLAVHSVYIVTVVSAGLYSLVHGTKVT
jgi:hypothetical protein